MAPVGPSMIEDNAIGNEHIIPGSVTREKMDAAFNELIDSLGGNEQELADATARLGAAETRLDSVFGSVDSLSGRFTDVESKATSAVSKAGSAQTAADSANSAAAAAQSKAETALSDAATAAGIAAGKGKVLVQSTAPAAEDRNAQTLWIDTTSGNNTPKRWVSGTTWSAVTDKAATNAASAAATAASAAATAQSAAEAAQATAAAAHAAAGSAQSAADNALTMAGSKSKVYYSTGNPTGTASAGDTWRKTHGTSKDVIAEWRYDGSPLSWVSQQISSDAISNLDVGKLTVGSAAINDLVVQNIAARTSQFIEADIGKLVVTGTANLSEAVARKFAANTGQFLQLSANNVYIGQGGNVFPGTDMTDSAWSSGSLISSSSTGGRFGGSSMTIKGSTAQSGSYFGLAVADRTKAPRLVRGATYKVSAWVKPSAALPAGGAGMYFRLYDSPTATGSTWTTPNVARNPAIAANAWGKIEGTITVPEGQTGDLYGVVGLFNEIAAGATNNLVFSDPSMVMAVTADLVVEGAIQTKHLEANSITVDKLRVSGSNAIPDPTFTDAKINAERLAGTTYAAGTMSFVADDVSGANVLRFTEKSNTQRSFRVGGTDDYVPVTLGDRIKMSVQYRVQGTGLSGSSNIRFALYHDSATKAYLRYVGVGAYREIYDVGDTWLQWEADYTITDADAKFIRPMIQFRNNGWTGHMEIKDPRLEVASRLSVTAPVDTGGTTQEVSLGIPKGKNMPGVIFTQSGPIGPPVGYESATISSDNGATINLYSGKPGGNAQGFEPSTVSLHNRGVNIDAGMNTGVLAMTAGGGATLNGQEVYYGGPTYRARVTLTNSFTHWTGSNWNGLWVEQIGKLTIISGATSRPTAWPAGGVVAVLPARFRPANKSAGMGCEIQPDGNLQLPAGSGPISYSITYFAA